MLNLKFKITNLKFGASGQAMIMTVMTISGAVLSATSIVGLLMVNEIRHTTSVISSAKALFAADAGIECALMQHKDNIDRGCGKIETQLSNGASFTVYDVEDELGKVIGKRSVGKHGKIARSLEAYF